MSSSCISPSLPPNFPHSHYITSSTSTVITPSPFAQLPPSYPPPLPIQPQTSACTPPTLPGAAQRPLPQTTAVRAAVVQFWRENDRWGAGLWTCESALQTACGQRRLLGDGGQRMLLSSFIKPPSTTTPSTHPSCPATPPCVHRARRRLPPLPLAWPAASTPPQATPPSHTQSRDSAQCRRGSCADWYIKTVREGGEQIVTKRQ